MQSTKTPDIAEEIARFIRGIPATIRNEVLVYVMMYGLDKYSLETGIFVPTICAALTRTSGRERMGAILRIVAALDYTLMRSERKGRSIIAKIKNSSGVSGEKRDIALARLPINQKHHEIAHSDWLTLRRTLITQQALLDYEDRLLAVRPAP
jgi:hypothetical protein